MRVLLVDHHDSFTWNLAHLVAAVTGALPEVVAHDDPALLTWDWARTDAVLLSPGPGSPHVPADARYSREALVPGRPPVLGVCLGMQLLVAEAGGLVDRAPEPRHGRLSTVRHEEDPLFAGVPSPFRVVRYHSLAWIGGGAEVEATAWSEDGVVMAVRHTRLPWWGVQFHPESIASEHGHTILANFLGSGERHAAPPRTRERRPWARELAGGERTPTRSAAPLPGEPDPGSLVSSGSLEPLPRTLARSLASTPDPERLAAALSREGTPCAWLDGAAGGTRWSVLGDTSGPLAYTVSYRAGGALTLRDRESTRSLSEPLLDFLHRALAAPRPPVADLPFSLGFVGSFGYELRADVGSPVATPSPLPDAELLFLDRAVVLDHLEGRTWLLALEHTENRRWMDETARLVATLPSIPPSPPPVAPRAPPAWRHERPAYRERILRCLDALRAGESYELCLTNQARVPAPVDPFAAYSRLRRASPAPFAALLRLPSFTLLSSSPERFLRVTPDGLVRSSPIKGTRRRHADPLEDAAARADLGASEKDRAENLMIVDLTRHDLGRVCEPGSVTVPRLFAVESYARVHQLVSTVEGRLREGLGAVDALAAAFPPGSMTGAPKLRSMTILEALEGGPRGPYAGALGYLSLCGGADLSVVIRSAVIADGEATVGVGGAIVALSEPDAEVAEMELKAEAVLEALGR